MSARVASIVLIAFALAPAAFGQTNFRSEMRDKVKRLQIGADTDNPHDPAKLYRPSRGRGDVRPTPHPNVAQPDNRSYKVLNRWTETIGRTKARIVSRYRVLVREPEAIGFKGHRSDAPEADEMQVKGRPFVPPAPDVLINSGWLYVNGIKPCVGTNGVVAQAESCVVAIQCYTQGVDTYHRVYYLEGEPDKFVWVFPRQTAANEAVLTVGTFVDAKIDPQNNYQFLRWKDGNGTERPTPRLLSDDDTNPNQYQSFLHELELLNEASD